MRRAYKLGIAAFAALAVSGIGARLYAQISLASLHPLNESCESCHLAGTDTTDNAKTLVASQEQLCGRCHANALQVSHLSGFIPPPRKTIPAVYPLDWKGDLTCSTCHAVHSDSPGKLRGTVTGRDMCLACHDQSFFDNMRDKGTSMFQSGHLLGISNSQNLQNMDPYSLQCMECHGEKGNVNIDSNLMLLHGSQNHPIGRSYAEAALHGDYKAAFRLSAKILLPNGVVSCVSCHEGYTKNHGKVVITTSGSSLCFECHVL